MLKLSGHLIPAAPEVRMGGPYDAVRCERERERERKREKERERMRERKREIMRNGTAHDWMPFS